MKDVTYADYCARVSEVVKHIHSSLDRPVDVAELAGMACLSHFHFQRVFAQVAGENCLRFVRRLRLERAAWKLQNTDESITDIAFQAGFDSLEAFSRAFRRSFASRATDFREARWLSYWLLTANGNHFSSDGRTSFYPLSQTGREVPFTVEQIKSFQVSRRLHPGAPHLVGKTCVALVAELRQIGLDLRLNPIVTYAPTLGPDTPVGEITTYVGVCADLPGWSQTVLGGGLHLVARHVGTGQDLGDFWIRLWKESLPSSGQEQRPGPCYQILQMNLFADKPAALLAQIYIPVQPK